MFLKWARLSVFWVLASTPAPLLAWGAVGHRTIAFIAWDYLTPQAKASAKKILGPGQYLDNVASWADAMVICRPETAPWHYIELSVRRGTTEYDEAQACPDHNCVVDQIGKDLSVLRNPFSEPDQKREALKFLIHFVGDIHQPLHCAGDGDRGGNDKWFRYYPGKSRNFFHWVSLHGFWDDLLEEKKEDPLFLARRLESEMTPSDESQWSGGKPEDWAFESFKIARDEIYPGLPEGPLLKKNRWGLDLPKKFTSPRFHHIVDIQLEKAGIRLAFLLNGVFENR